MKVTIRYGTSQHITLSSLKTKFSKNDKGEIIFKLEGLYQVIAEAEFANTWEVIEIEPDEQQK